MLKEIAQKGDGVYVKAQGTQLGLEYLLGRLSEMQKSEIQTLDFINYESYYFFFVYLALFFLGLEVFISRHKK